MDDIALVDLAQSGLSRYRRGQPRIAQLQLGVIDLGLVHFHETLILLDLRFLGHGLLRGNRILFKQGLVTGMIDLGIFQQGFIA